MSAPTALGDKGRWRMPNNDVPKVLSNAAEGVHVVCFQGGSFPVLARLNQGSGGAKMLGGVLK